MSQLPEATPPGKVSSVIRTGLEMVAKAAFDPEKVIDLMQEGCGVRVVVKHKGKILKKVKKKNLSNTNNTRAQKVTRYASICISLAIVKLRFALEYNRDDLTQVIMMRCVYFYLLISCLLL